MVHGPVFGSNIDHVLLGVALLFSVLLSIVALISSVFLLYAGNADQRIGSVLTLFLSLCFIGLLITIYFTIT